MKIAIVSDTHNNWPNFKKTIEWIKKEKIQLILHCGDISSQETIDQAKEIFDGPASAESYGEAKDIKFVRGNGDFGLNLPEKMELNIEGNPPSPGALARQRKIAFCHFPNIAKELAQSGKYNVVFYGHTHKPWDEKIENCRMINPGELAGQLYKPTFAVYDTATGSLELKILEHL